VDLILTLTLGFIFVDDVMTASLCLYFFVMITFETICC